MSNLPENLPAAARPPLTLVCGAAGTGKTEWAVTRYLASEGRALLLAASPAQAATLAAQIAARSEITEAEAQKSVLSFRKFISETYQARPKDGFQTMSRAFQRAVLCEIVPQTIHSNDFLSRMLDAPGFVGAFADRLREWKLACITPDTLEAGCCAAEILLDDAAFPAKSKEFVRLFRAYETFLKQHRMRDEEDCLQEVIRFIANGPALAGEPRQVIVDGFFRFNRAQREILAALADRRTASGSHEIAVAVTLPLETCRPLLFAAAQRTRETLGAEFAAQETLLSHRQTKRPPALRVIEAELFRPEASEGKEKTENRKQKTEEGANADAEAIQNPKSKIQNKEAFCQLFDAPNPYVEAEMIAREFRRIHDAGNYSWNDFGIILRTQGDYAPILSAVFERYEIPLGVDGPEKLDQNPLIKTVLHLLDILCGGWQRDDVLAFLKSSYTGADKLAADGMRRRARAAHIRGGRAEWLALAEKTAETPLASAGASLQKIADCADDWAAERSDPMTYAEGLRAAVKDVFGMLERAAHGETLRKEKDFAAWSEADDVLSAVAQMAAIAGREAVSFAQFCAALKDGWGSASSKAEPDGEMARVMEPYESRERPLRIAAVIGLTERVFPRRISEDPFFRDAERAALRQAANLDLEEQRDRADDERLFFYLAVTAPAERLILSYPRSSDDSDTLPSFYLDEVRAVFASEAGKNAPPLHIVSRTLADVAPQPEEAVNEADRLLAACADLFEPAGSEPALAAARQQAAAAQLSQHLANRTAGVRALLVSRSLPNLPRFEDNLLQSDFACAKSVYSVTELETYLRCPFQYLLRHVLKMRPEEDSGAAMQGDLLHSVLRRYFRRRKKEQSAAPPPDAETLRGELRALLQETLAAAPIDAPPHRARMMGRTLFDAVDGFAQREARFTPQFKTRPAHFELAFGFDAGETGGEDGERGGSKMDGAGRPAYDPASIAEPLALTGANGDAKPVHLCGVIDRVDFDPSGIRAVIMDYKLGRPPDFAAIAGGSSLQMPLYLLAMERLFGKTGAAACYDSALETGRRRIYRTEHVGMKDYAPLLPHDSSEHVKPQNRQQFAEITRTAEMSAIGAARAIESGRIEANPGEHCAACDYKDVCRTTVTHGHDGEILL